MGTVGHVSDIGGTKDSLRAREIYEEGFQIPPMKLYEAGKLNETLTRLLGENVRNSEQVLGDLHSFVAANRIGAERLQAFLQDYGMQDLRALASVVQDRSEKAMRDAISALADGTYHGSVSNNPLGTGMTYPGADSQGRYYSPRLYRCATAICRKAALIAHSTIQWLTLPIR